MRIRLVLSFFLFHRKVLLGNKEKGENLMGQDQQSQKKPEQNLSKDLQKNLEVFNRLFQDCDDVIRRPMRLGRDQKVDCFVAYVEVAVSNMMLQDSVIGKLINRMWDMTRDEIYEYIRCNGLGISDVKELPTMETAVAALMAGNAIMFIDGYDKAIKISSKGYPNMGCLLYTSAFSPGRHHFFIQADFRLTGRGYEYGV